MPVHRTIAIEHSEKVFGANGDHQGQTDGRGQTVATAHPVPKLEHIMVPIDAELRYPLWVGGDGHKMPGRDLTGLRRFRVLSPIWAS